MPLKERFQHAPVRSVLPAPSFNAKFPVSTWTAAEATRNQLWFVDYMLFGQPGSRPNRRRRQGFVSTGPRRQPSANPPADGIDGHPRPGSLRLESPTASRVWLRSVTERHGRTVEAHGQETRCAFIQAAFLLIQSSRTLRCAVAATTIPLPESVLTGLLPGGYLARVRRCSCRIPRRFGGVSRKAGHSWASCHSSDGRG